MKYEFPENISEERKEILRMLVVAHKRAPEEFLLRYLFVIGCLDGALMENPDVALPRSLHDRLTAFQSVVREFMKDFVTSEESSTILELNEKDRQCSSMSCFKDLLDAISRKVKLKDEPADAPVQ